MQNEELADQLWEHVYQTFERHPADGVQTAFASKQVRNEVQVRLMRNIAALKAEKNEQTAQALANDIWADALMSNSQGWMTNETCGLMQDLLAELMPLEQDDK